MIIFLGVAGSGKSTQGKLLAQKLGCPWLSTGEILRSNLSDEFKEDMKRGKLVGDDIILPLLDSELQNHDAKHAEIIGDGWPRNIVQAKWLDEHIKAGDFNLTAILYIKMDKNLARERIRMQGRSDASDQAVEQRFAEYEHSVIPALDYLKSLGYPVIDIDGSGSIEEVQTNIYKALEGKIEAKNG